MSGVILVIWGGVRIFSLNSSPNIEEFGNIKKYRFNSILMISIGATSIVLTHMILTLMSALFLVILYIAFAFSYKKAQ
jgi:hypothetical protein